MSVLKVNGVRLDTLLVMEPGTIVDAVPATERDYFSYWRGGHLGKLALNLLRGRMVINAGENDNLIFFSNQYSEGPRIGKLIADRARFQDQWKEADAQRFFDITGVQPPSQFGAIVYAARYIGHWPTSRLDPGVGNSVEAPVGFHEIDRYSVQALEEIFEVDLLSQPEPGASHAPAPGRGLIVPPSVSRYEHIETWYMPGRAPRT